MTTHKVTFLYIRITEREDKTGESELQGRELAQWCTQNKIKNFQIFADRGAAKLTDKRPAYERLMERMKVGECENFVILSFSRLARTKAELLSTLECVRSQKVRFVSLQDQLDTRSSINVLNFLQAIMKMEKEVIGERLQSGRNKSTAQSLDQGSSL